MANYAPPQAYFTELLPFHLVVDEDLRAVQAGRLLAEHLPQPWLGEPLHNLLTVRRPLVQRLTKDALRSRLGRLWLCEIPSGLLLKGAWQAFPEGYFFLATAWISNLDELKRINLDINELPLHDGASDLLMLVQQQSTSLRELKEISESLDQQRSLAEQASRAKTAFLATMSHEIRTPMNGVLGMTEALMDTHLTSEQQEITHTIKQSALHLIHIINDVLDFSRLEAGRMDIHPAPTPVGALIAESCEMCAALAQDKHLNITQRLEMPANTRYLLDAVRVRQVLLNLLGNAIKFTPSHGEVHIEAVEDAGRLRFSVRDTGCGMTQSEAEQMFEPYRQSNTDPTRSAEGSGLGLAICARIVAASGGDIGVTSQPGAGSTFFFDLPAERVTTSEPMAPAGPARAARHRNLKGHVLLVEDNRVNQKVAEAHLRSIGLMVTIANHGLEALKLVEDLVEATPNGKFDLVLMDCHMPHLDGLDTTRELRKRGIRWPIIALTADILEEAREQCLAAGMDDVLTKPLQRDELLMHLTRWISSASTPETGAGDP